MAHLKESEDEGDDRGAEQDEHESVGELLEDQPPHRHGRRRGQLVAPVQTQAMRGLGLTMRMRKEGAEIKSEGELQEY
jgi:hypothetical protein